MTKLLSLNEISQFFEKYFNSLKAKPLKNLKELENLADKIATNKTKYGARVFNKVYQTARRVQETFHSTPWRDKQITADHLKVVKATSQALKSKKIPLYKMWVRSGSGNQTKIWELIFTKKGAPLALTAAIMMEPIFENPKKQGLKINGKYLAVPELVDIVDSQDSPLVLVEVGNDNIAYIWVGGSDYPGEIYKPICKAHNGWVYDSSGFEIHGAAYVADYLNKKAKKEKVLVVISGLSLHGKSALSTSNGVEPGYFENITKNQEVVFHGIHDDYVAFLPLNKQKSRWEVFSYAPQGLFPACHGDAADSPLTANDKTALFSVYIGKDGTPDFSKEVNQSVNQRAASPINTLEVFRNGERQVKDFDRVALFILTRSNFCPSGVIFKNAQDFAWSYAGVVVQKTDAIAGNFPDIYYNFACTDFDVVQRHKYLERLVKTFSNFSKPITLAMINTGAPGPEESMRVRDAIASGWYEADFDKKLGVEVLTHAPGFKNLYFPWKQGKFSYNQVVKAWQQQQQERRDFMANRVERKGNCDPKKLAKLIGKPQALV
ncbi:hypothetical protein ACFLZ1_00085 [Patescibacteria group bacterium]